jgi:hypothetical protein
MLRASCALIASLLFSLSAPASAQDYYSGWQKGPWKFYEKADNIEVYTNSNPPKGTGVDAVRVDVIISGSIEKLFYLIIDHKRSAKFSFVREYKVVKEGDKEAFVYQRVMESGLDDRDFTVHVKLIKPDGDQGAWGYSWQQANQQGPPPRKGVVRASMVQGSYVLTPLADGRIKVSYRLIFDPNTWIPDFVLRRAVRKAAVETVRTLIRDAKQQGITR